MVEISVRSDPYRDGWSSVAVLDVTDDPGQHSLLTCDEAQGVTRLLEAYAGWADAQLAPGAFPRPTVSNLVIDPIPDRLARMLVPDLAYRLADIFQDRHGPPPDPWVAVRESFDAALLALTAAGAAVGGSDEADTLRAYADTIMLYVLPEEGD